MLYLLRGGRLAEGSSAARLESGVLWGATEGGRIAEGAEGGPLPALPRDGDSGLGVEDADVAVRGGREEEGRGRERERMRENERESEIAISSEKQALLSALSEVLLCRPRTQ